MIWYSFKPVDTLFFRGGEPMEMGESHAFSIIFPPSVQTISGALRTAVLKQNNIDINDYYSNSSSLEEIIRIIGKAGETASFSITGPLLRKNKEIFFPAPYSWFYSGEEGCNGKNTNSLTFETEIKKLKKIESPLINFPRNIYWLKSGSEKLESAGGLWVSSKDLFSSSSNIRLYKPGYFYSLEERTGIALENRMVRESHIYSAVHVRMHEDADIIFAVNTGLPISDKGILMLGGEQRFGSYSVMENADNILPEKQEGELWLSIAPVPAGKVNSENIAAAGKPVFTGGWDMKKRFHKDMTGFYPAGSVFDKKINSNTILI